jgi:plastocyanin
MPKKIAAILIFLVLVFAVVYFLYRQGAKPAQTPVVPSSQDQAQQNQVLNKAASSAQPPATATGSGAQINLGNKQLKGTFSSGEGQPDGSAISVVEIDFDGSKFVPASVDIKVNDWVFFKNKSTTDMWVASNPHPTHTDYPGFDSKQPISPGSEYKFQFTKAGNWGFHDHLNPSIGGVVNVTP